MRFDKYHVLAFIFIILLLMLFLIKPKITTFAVVEDFQLELDKDNFLPNSTLEGKIYAEFEDEIPLNADITLAIGDDEYKLDIASILGLLNLTYDSEEASVTAINPAETLTLSKREHFAFMLPKNAKISSFSMNLESGSPEPSSGFYLDIDNDSRKEWQFLGDFDSFSSEIFPVSLSQDNIGDPVLIDDNSTLHCEVIDVPLSKDFEVSANYRKLNGTADIRAIMLSFVQGSGYGGGNFCDLPDDAGLDWHSCQLNFSSAVSGNHLVCIYLGSYSGNQDFFSLERDNTPSSARYDCSSIGDGYANCNLQSSKDYFVSVKPATYSGKLTNPVNFEQGKTGWPFNISINDYLANCDANEVNDCIVPVYTNNDGVVKVKDLNILYKESGGSDSSTNKIYAAEIKEAIITHIDGIELKEDPYNVTIPVGLFNARSPSDTGIYTLDADISTGQHDSYTIRVSLSTTPKEVSDLSGYITKTKDDIEELELEYEMLFNIFRIEINETGFNNYKRQADELKVSNMSESELAESSARLRNGFENMIKNLPQEISLKESFSDNLAIDLSAIEDLKLDSRVSSFQEKVNIQSDIKIYGLTTFAGKISDYAIVEKTVTPKETLTSSFIYEIIPKNAASTLNNVNFLNTNFEPVRDDPIVRFSYPSLSSPQRIVYGVKDVSLEALLKANTLVVPKQLPKKEETSYVCGDNICVRPFEDEIICPADCEEKSGLLWLYIIIIAIGLGVFAYIWFYKGKYNIREVSKKIKNPFSSQEHLKIVKHYINSSLRKGLTNEDISKALLERGWTKDQVTYGFEEVWWEQKKNYFSKTAPSSTSDMKKLVEFIKKAKEGKLSRDRIYSLLLAKNWDKKQIDKAFRKSISILDIFRWKKK